MEYSDFRTYPLNINWKDLDSLNNDSYEIKQEFGLIGVSIYFKIVGSNNLGEKAFKITPDKFVNNLIEFYFDNFEKGTYESLVKLSALIKSFPENEKLYMLIRKKLILKKELILVKLVLDLKLHYYMNYDKMNLKVLNSIIFVLKEFYKSITNEKLRNLYEKIKEDKVLKKFYCDDKLLNLPKKANYISELKKLKNYNNELFGGIDYQKFCI